MPCNVGYPLVPVLGHLLHTADVNEILSLAFILSVLSYQHPGASVPNMEIWCSG